MFLPKDLAKNRSSLLHSLVVYLDLTHLWTRQILPELLTCYYQPTLLLCLFIQSINWLEECFNVHPVRRVLKPSCIKEQHSVAFWMESTQWGEVSISSLGKGLSTHVGNCIYVISARCCLDNSFKKGVVKVGDKGSTCVQRYQTLTLRGIYLLG